MTDLCTYCESPYTADECRANAAALGYCALQAIDAFREGGYEGHDGDEYVACDDIVGDAVHFATVAARWARRAQAL